MYFSPLFLAFADCDESAIAIWAEHKLKRKNEESREEFEPLPQYSPFFDCSTHSTEGMTDDDEEEWN